MRKLSGESLNITEENLAKLKRLFPEAFIEGKIDFDVLRQLLGDFVDDEEERYSFKWNGKGKALRLSQTPSLGTLRPCKEESKDWDMTQNLYIEGDNLEVLKLLQKSYYGKVKMIYIDPPYNTGNDFVYKDDFRDNIENYKRVTGQVDGEGHKIDTNTDSNGRFHTDWLNMMYPRLRLARNLLAEDGVIFISIDDNEQGNLKKICDEVFGESNFIAQCVRKRRDSQANLSKNISPIHEYVFIYSKQFGDILNKVPGNINEMDYKNPDNDYRGPYVTMPCTNKGGSVYTVVTPTGKEITDEWRFTRETYETLKNENKIVFPRNGEGKPRYKIFLKDKKADGVLANTWLDSMGANQVATREIKSIFDDSVLFDTPKPVQLLQFCTQIATNGESLILDFFSGSSTTAHSVMQLNAEDGGNRKFIMVQLPEPTAENSEAAKAGYKNICEIGKERIRRAGEKIKAEAGENAENLDVGFKVFKLDSSNLQKWNPQPKELELSFQESIENFLPQRTELDVVYEILLKMGLDLSLPIEERAAAGEKVYIVGYGALMICLGKNITVAVAEGIVKLHKEYESKLWQVVFRDNGFASDKDKTNIRETLKAAGLDEDSFVCV